MPERQDNLFNMSGHVSVERIDETFSAERSERARERGMERAAIAKHDQVAYAREIAKKIALSKPERTCTADEVQRVLVGEGIDLGPAAGAIFKSESWRFTGQWVKSARVKNHSRMLRVWEYREPTRPPP